MFKVASLVWLAVLFFQVSSFGQKKDFAYYDQLTFELYEKQLWVQVIATAREAKKSGFDYYYLNMRLGIAYFERKQYFKAIPAFENAIEFNQTDMIAPEYLYLCYQFTNQELQAAEILKKFPAIQSRVYDKPGKIFSGLFLEGTYKFHDLNYVSNLGLFNLGLQHRPFHWLSVTHSYNRMSFDQIELMSSPGGGRLQERRNLIMQKGYYARMDLNLAGFIITPAINLQRVHTSKFSYPEKVYYVGIGRRVSNFYAGFSFSKSEINLFEQRQWSASLTWYPLSNLNLYLVNQLTRHQQQEFKNTIVYHKLGFKLANHVWLEIFHQYGNIFNFTTDQAYLLFNGWDNINSRSGASFRANVSANIDLNLSFIMEKHNEFNSDSIYSFSVINSSVNFKF